jgi:general secretion pathway protein A
LPGYVEYFGLKEPPFKTAPNPRFAFATRAHEIELLRVQDSVEQRLGLCLLVGAIGAGKSTVAHLLLSSWAASPDKYAVAYISDPSQRTPAGFLRELVAGFGLPTARNLTSNRNTLRGLLVDCYAAKKTVVVMLDEAQTIYRDNMETLQHLSNEQTSDDKLLQIVLFAQPNIYHKLKYFPALNSRIARRGTLDPLIFEDAINMMRYRVEVAGGDFSALFDKSSHRPIHNATEGNPRKVCILCDTALFEAFVLKKKSVDAEAVAAAVEKGFGEEIK